MIQSTPLKGVDGVFRRRVDAYRVLFALARFWVHVYSVQHRRSVYEGDITLPRALPPDDVPEWPELTGSDVPGPAAPDDSPAPATEVDWDDIARVVITREAEALYPLIDAGIPTHTFDELYKFLNVEKRSVEQLRNVHVIRENVIDEFFGRFLLLPEALRPTELTIVSPWLTPWEGPKSSFTAFYQALQKSPIPTTVITRTRRLRAHERCISQLGELRNVELVLLDDLHAKFFVCDLPPVPFALVGSANSTAQSFENYEIGMFIRGSGEAEGVIRDLQSLAVELRAAGKRVKRRGMA